MEWYKNWRYANLMTSGYGCDKCSRIDDVIFWTLVILKHWDGDLQTLVIFTQRTYAGWSRNSGVMLLGHQWVSVFYILTRALKPSKICYGFFKDGFFFRLDFRCERNCVLASRELRSWYCVFSVNRRINALYKLKLIFENDSAIKIILATERIFSLVKIRLDVLFEYKSPERQKTQKPKQTNTQRRNNLCSRDKVTWVKSR